MPVLGYGEKQGKLYITMPLMKSLHSVLHSDKEEGLTVKEKIKLML